MEEFHQRIGLDLDKLNNLFISPMLLPANLDFSKMRNTIQNFESPMFTYNDLLKTNLSFHEPLGIAALPKEDDFRLDSGEQVKVEQPNVVNQVQIEQPQLDITFDLPNQLKPIEQLVNFNTISRSRGPSFHMGRPRLESEDLFNGTFDFLNYFRNPELQVQNLENQLSLQNHELFNAAEYLLPGITASPNILPKQIKVNPEMAYGFALQPYMMDMNQLRNLQNEMAGEQPAANNENPNLPAPSAKNKSKKKKKLNNGESATNEVESASSPKLKKSKSDNKKQAFSVTPNSNTLKLKITKVNDIKGFGNQSNSNSKNSKKIVLKHFASEINTKIENGEERTDDRSTEISSNMSIQAKLEEGAHGNKSKTMISKPLQSNNTKDLLGGYTLPSEIEEFIHNNSGILNHLQFPSMRKIGTLTVEERRIKIEKYLQKRKKRTWSKKISYDCRKRVADSRLRIKGRFVTKDQAFAMLGPDAIGRDITEITTTEIKNLLNQKFGASITKKKDIKDKEKNPNPDNKAENHEEEEEEEEDDEEEDNAEGEDNE